MDLFLDEHIEALQSHAHSEDRNLIHARESAHKQFCLEQASDVINMALLIRKRRAYVRVNSVERLYRDIRVDRNGAWKFIRASSAL